MPGAGGRAGWRARRLLGVDLSLSLTLLQNGNTALAIAKRLGYISVVDTLKVVTEEVTTTTTVSKRAVRSGPGVQRSGPILCH